MMHTYTRMSLTLGAALVLGLGCGQSQQQSDTNKPDSTQVASAPPPQQQPTTSTTTSQPAKEIPAAQPASKPATQSTTPKNTQPTKPVTKEPEPPKMVTIPTGTTFVVALETHLRTDSNKTGDSFRARTIESIRINEMTVIPAGTEVRGHLTLVEEPHRTSGKAQMTLAFDEFVDANGKVHAMTAEPIPLEAEGDKVSDEAKVAGGAVIGGIIGALSSKKKTSGAAKGAAAGAVAGGAIALATKGKQLDLPPGQQFSVALTAPVEVPAAQLTADK